LEVAHEPECHYSSVLSPDWKNDDREEQHQEEVEHQEAFVKDEDFPRLMKEKVVPFVQTVSLISKTSIAEVGIGSRETARKGLLKLSQGTILEYVNHRPHRTNY